MTLKPLLEPVLLYTGLLGLLTVGTVYLATHSLLYILVLTAGGLLVVVLNGGTAGRTSLAGPENSDEGESEFETTGLVPQTNPDTPLRLVLLLYGLGVFLWCLVVLATLRNTLG
ncbi:MULTISPECIES: hypothetical protein [Halolamina]|uniref:DUF8070 domain-containing protein n=1 Tax=Halolamina pelagica TaxID=699431 RepID=A0A1I5TXQ8_9EURY|nr:MULTISPECIES: hypothetical protein [Halolamina]NHX36695.1 hypothetical protein [Halolamina sp. R1-12]SFP87845.1 hypothetical protein SAMN05216277_11110 [Halolamina pelagica]